MYIFFICSAFWKEEIYKFNKYYGNINGEETWTFIQPTKQKKNDLHFHCQTKINKKQKQSSINIKYKAYDSCQVILPMNPPSQTTNHQTADVGQMWAGSGVDTVERLTVNSHSDSYKAFLSLPALQETALAFEYWKAYYSTKSSAT